MSVKNEFNLGNLIRKKTRGYYQDNRSYYTGNYRGRGGYKFGFRGGSNRGRFTPGFRGRGGNTEGYQSGYQSGFRGRGSRGFGRYRSKFDDFEPNNTQPLTQV
jgi:hypothetical protein